MKGRFRFYFFGIVLITGYALPVLGQTDKEASEGQRVEWKLGDSGAAKLVGDHVLVENTSDQPMQVNLTEIVDPKIEANVYCLVGRLRSTNVKGSAYLEMWSHFPDGGAYFTKTLGQASGPMSDIRGTTDWREFQLPFDRTGASPPKRLEVRLVMSGSGSVELADLQLKDLPNGLAGQTSSATPLPAPVAVMRGSWLWVLLLCFAALVILASTAIGVWYARRQSRNELRRMSSMDVR